MTDTALIREARKEAKLFRQLAASFRETTGDEGAAYNRCRRRGDLLNRLADALEARAEGEPVCKRCGGSGTVVDLDAADMSIDPEPWKPCPSCTKEDRDG